MYHSMGLEKRKFPIFLIHDFILGLINLVHFVMLMLLHNRLMHLEVMGWFKQLICYKLLLRKFYFRDGIHWFVVWLSYNQNSIVLCNILIIVANMVNLLAPEFGI